MVVGCLGARGFCWQCAGGARPRCGVGHGGFAAVGGRARCRVHVQHPWPPPWGGCRPLLRWGVVAPLFGGAALLLFWWGVCWVRPFRRVLVVCWGCGGCGGLFVICIVVASIFVVCARPPFLFRLARVRGACGGACGPRARPVAGVWACFLLCVVLWGIRWMPWHQELMKDVAACDMPRGVGERALIRGCPNGGTRPGLCWATII